MWYGFVLVLHAVIKISSHHDWHHRKVTNIVGLTKHDTQLHEDTTLMRADIVAGLVTQDANALSAPKVGQSIDLVSM